MTGCLQFSGSEARSRNVLTDEKTAHEIMEFQNFWTVDSQVKIGYCSYRGYQFSFKDLGHVSYNHL